MHSFKNYFYSQKFQNIELNEIILDNRTLKKRGKHKLKLKAYL